MASRPQKKTAALPVFQVDPQACVGCVVCMQVCPAKAIRVRGGTAVILPEYCVDCGCCYRACPHHAIQTRDLAPRRIEDCPHPVAVASPTLFSQFGHDVTPNQVLMALKRIGFEEVVDLTWQCAVTSRAIEQYLLDHPELRPGISPTCPVVVQLIRRRFPGLVKNIIPLLPPRLAVARWVKARLAERLGCPREDVGIYYISPCAARMAVDRDPVFIRKHYIDGMLCFHDVYGKLLAAMKELPEDDHLEKCCTEGLSWAESGGQAGSVRVEHTLAVAGFHEAVAILEMLEAGRLPELRFVEILTCPEGCLGGPLTLDNRFRAKSVIRHLIRTQSAACRIKDGVIKEMLESGYYEPEVTMEPRPARPLAPTRDLAIAKLKEINRLAHQLPHYECGLCGSPDCHTFAVDVVTGLAKREECGVLTLLELEAARPEAARLRDEGFGADRPKEVSIMTVRELVEALEMEVAAGEGGLGREVTGVYISDMLSAVIAAAPAGCLWLTIQAHQNVAAVAALQDMAGVCLVEGKKPQDDTRQKADQEGIPLLTSELDAYALAGRLHGLGLGAAA